jgi:glycosyltransferase involved in cell wall biosynthesis
MTAPHIRLAYIADVPVEASYHGSALIYRLLRRFSAEHLVIVEQSTRRSSPTRRLPDVRYEELPVGAGRLLTTRAHRLAGSWLTLKAKQQAGQVAALLGPFRPQAVLTVSHGVSWLTAAAFADRNGLPLHLIAHDDWPRMSTLIGPVQRWMENRFCEVYRQAVTRLCVSPRMMEEYERRYGVRGRLLYPSRAPDTPVFATGSASEPAGRPFTVAYAGSLSVGDYVRQLVALSWILPSAGGRLLLFGPFDFASLKAKGINTQCVSLSGMLESQELIKRLNADADVVFVPESFESGHAMNLSFPSKLTDYTAAATPLLIWGPEGSAAVNWAAAEPGVAAVVTEQNERSMAKMLERLAADSGWRRQLSAAAVEVGKRYFSAERAEAVFYDALTVTRPRASNSTG